MKKEFFRKLANNLANKYSKEQLAKLLVKNKDRRISNLIAAAYNILCLGNNLNHSATETRYDYLKRTVGPGTWIYEILESSEGVDNQWEVFQNHLKNCKTNDERSACIGSFYHRFSNR